MHFASRKVRPYLLVVLALSMLALLFVGCNLNTPTSPSHLSLIAVSGTQSASHSLQARTLDAPAWGLGHIVSGPPASFTFTLKSIMLQGTFADGGTVAQIWSDAAGKEITVSGTGAADLSGLADIGSLPVGNVTGVKIVVDAKARITGELVEAAFTSGTIAHLYTKSAGAYDSLHQTGGAALSSFTTGPAEPTDVYWNGGDNLVNQEIVTPVSYTLTAGAEMPKLTILLDVSRALRFYDGLGGTYGGPSPIDSSDKAYFFSHSVLVNSIACFFGDIGTIQGYQTIFDVTAGVGQPVDIPGWATFIYDSSGNILSGILSGDDDNALTVAKGKVTSSTLAAGAYNFTYDISGVDVTGFTKVSTVDHYADAAWAQATGNLFGGTARFILKLEL